jgi:hypothetical protein
MTVRVPSACSISRRARNARLSPYWNWPSQLTLPAYQPSPSAAPSTLAPCWTRSVTSYVWYGNRDA